MSCSLSVKHCLLRTMIAYEDHDDAWICFFSPDDVSSVAPPIALSRVSHSGKPRFWPELHPPRIFGAKFVSSENHHDKQQTWRLYRSWISFLAPPTHLGHGVQRRRRTPCLRAFHMRHTQSKTNSDVWQTGQKAKIATDRDRTMVEEDSEV